MGAKDSKPSFISYEDAVKRVPESELRRIREAFKRCAGANGTALSLEAFVHEVLCDGVPYAVADWLYQACGGTKRGIAFRDLFCGIVVFTKGNLEEKIKFLWTLYVNNQTDNGTYIYKWDFARALHLENTSLPVTGAPRTAEILTGLFGPSEKATFDQFRSWLLIHKDATVLSKWLLLDISNAGQELETPTFYQSLAGVTHLEERDIIELEKCFWSLRNSAPTGQLDVESLAPLLSPPLPRAAVAGAFLAFDENRDGHVDFKELCCGLSAACRGPRTERLKFCFKIFDLDRDGVLNKKELIDMVGILCTVANESLKNQSSRASTPSDGDGDEGTDKGFDPEVVLLNLREKLIIKPKDGRKPVFQLGPNGEGEEIVVAKDPEPEKIEDEGLIAKDMALTQEDFLIWSVETAETLVTPFLELIFEVCHIVLGLRPQCKHQERDIVLGWLRREVSRGYSVGQFWYLVAAEWWSAWLAWTAPGADACCRQPPARQIDEAIVCDESFTSNSTESMGSLLWRADTVSLGSAGSSSGVSSAAAQRAPRHPGPIDNRRLLAPNPLKVRTLTGEGGHLRRDATLAQHRDFELLPDALWRALAHWYGGSDPLPRQVIRPPNSDVELELYPLHLKLLRHVPNTQRANSIVAAGGVSLYGSAALAGAPAPPERHLAYTAAFSRLATVKQVTEFICQALGLAREDVRLWSLGGSAVLLDDERPTLHELRLDERSRLLVEVRNPDLTWPEEIGALGGGGGRGMERRETLTAPDLPGATGLHNLGNTCYMNAALQSVWNTGPLTRYFNSGMHLYEVNTTNPLGTKGTLALRYGELCKEVWSCAARSVAPLRVRWCVSRWARALAGGGQHDAQELLAWLLDALHEDLNRAPRAPPARTPHRAPASQRDSDGRPDQVVATEAWEQHTSRNQSIVTELFYGQLKSKVRCDACGRDSVRFDAFNMLSLPLPMESYVRKELRVILLDGSVPIKYGVRVNSEGTYYDLKKRLSELCELPPESMLLAELNGSLIGRVMEDSAKVGASGELYAFETPRHDPDSDESESEHEQEHEHEHGCCESMTEAEAGARAERSRSEILMSQSPPNTFYENYNHATYTENNIMEHRCNTLPKDLSEMKKIEKNCNSSPTLSVKSLNLKPSSPRLGKVKFGSSPSDMNRIYEAKDTYAPIGRIQYLVAVHRKQSRSDAYFLPWQKSRAGVFGVPVLVAVRDGLSGRALYARVWAQVARLLSARPPPAPRPHHNHATDCDDSLGYEFPFTLRAVDGAGAWCALCAWPRQCRGCALPSDDEPLLYGCSPGAGGSARVQRRAGAGSAGGAAAAADAPDGSSPIARAKLSRQCSARLNDDDGSPSGGELRRLDLGVVRARRGVLMLAIDWDPTALHLRYQTTREKAFVEHSSVASCASEAARPVDLGSCLRAFTREERLDERYHCAACHAAQPATKKLQIWRLPPILIIHLKRFQYVNNKWIKSQKVVNFPFEDFDPTAYLASVPQETILRHHELKNMAKRHSSMLIDVAGHISESDSENSEDEAEQATSSNGTSSKDASKVKAKVERKRKGSMEVRGRERLESTSLVTTPITDDNLVDYHQHHLKSDQDPFDLKYRLYAVVSHSGQMSGGHYVAYARNPSGAWLCYNDSSCRELTPVRREPHPAPVPPIDPATAYLLFYERQGLDYEPYLPDTAGREPVVNVSDSLDPDENDLRKMCVIS